MPDPIVISAAHLRRPSLRQQLADTLHAIPAAIRRREDDEKGHRAAIRASRRRADRTARADRLGYAALRGREPDYVNGWLYLAEDDSGSICGPSAARRGWYTGFRWWKPLHALAWLRTWVTGRIVFVEGE